MQLSKTPTQSPSWCTAKWTHTHNHHKSVVQQSTHTITTKESLAQQNTYTITIMVYCIMKAHTHKHHQTKCSSAKHHTITLQCLAKWTHTHTQSSSKRISERKKKTTQSPLDDIYVQNIHPNDHFQNVSLQSENTITFIMKQSGKPCRPNAHTISIKQSTLYH